MNFPGKIRDLCQALVDGLNAELGAKLFGMYLYGAWAFPGTDATGDIDFHVILSNALTGSERLSLKALHATMAERYPPYGAELDGYYILLGEARGSIPPRHQIYPEIVDNAWALHRAHIRAGRCFALHGPDPRKIYLEPAWAELDRALQDELDYVKEHLRVYPAYCVLNLCRLMYSYSTRDVVVSKVEAARWAWGAVPDWKHLIETARKSYQGSTTPQEQDLLRSHVMIFFDFAREYVAERRNLSASP